MYHIKSTYALNKAAGNLTTQIRNTYDCFLNLNTSLTMSVENQYRYIRQQIN